MLGNMKPLLLGYRFIDLFAGIGGFRLALESFGANCVYSNEWDIHAQQVYFENFGECPEGDITQVDENDIPLHDVLCAGFPCQPFSISGKQKGFEDIRGTLFFDIARIVKLRKPKVVFMENVKNLATHGKGQTIEVIKSIMEQLGYTFYNKVLNAVDFGVPQNRERIFMVCFRNDIISKSFKFPASMPLKRHVEDNLLEESEIDYNLFVNRKDIVIKDIKDEKYSSKPIRLGTVNKGGQGERIYSVKGSSITLSANGGGVFAKTGGYLVNGKYRKLHPKECARLMGYPDKYKISNNRNQAYKQFGNSVVIDVLQYVIMEFAKVLSENDNERDST